MSKLKKGFRSVKRIIRKAYVRFSGRMLRLHDRITDRRICGRSLVAFVPSISGDEKTQIGGTGSESSHYVYLKRIFSHVKLTENDTVIDVGCGKGRVLAFLLREKCPGALYGVELNADVAKIAQEWTASRYPHVHVEAGDAFAVDYNNYTVLTMSRPFFVHTFQAFVEKLEETVTHPITVVSWHEDTPVTAFIRVRSGWHSAYHENTNRIHGLYLGPCSQPFTVWTYDPDARKAQEATGSAEA